MQTQPFDIEQQFNIMLKSLNVANAPLSLAHKNETLVSFANAFFELKSIMQRENPRIDEETLNNTVRELLGDCAKAECALSKPINNFSKN